MKRLRNVAVRMRPPSPLSDPAPDRASITGLGQRGDDEIPSEPQQAIPPRRRNIWEMEQTAGDPSTGTIGSPVTPAEAERPASPPMTRRPAEVGAAARTRILGFHAPEIAPDALSTVDRGAPRFAAGWLVVVDGPGRGADFVVTAHVASIGRGTDQDIVLDFGDTSISRESHAAVVHDPEQNRFFFGHGNKANVVRRNGQPVLATEELFDGDLIRIGRTTLRFVALCGPNFRWDEDPDLNGGSHDG